MMTKKKVILKNNYNLHLKITDSCYIHIYELYLRDNRYYYKRK